VVDHLDLVLKRHVSVQRCKPRTASSFVVPARPRNCGRGVTGQNAVVRKTAQNRHSSSIYAPLSLVFAWFRASLPKLPFPSIHPHRCNSNRQKGQDFLDKVPSKDRTNRTCGRPNLFIFRKFHGDPGRGADGKKAPYIGLTLQMHYSILPIAVVRHYQNRHLERACLGLWSGDSHLRLSPGSLCQLWASRGRPCGRDDGLSRSGNLNQSQKWSGGQLRMRCQWLFRANIESDSSRSPKGLWSGEPRTNTGRLLR
jgi:hypothetical protein